MWVDAIVMPREEEVPYRPAPQRDRRALHEAHLREGRKFRERVLSYLHQHQLMNAVHSVSEPGSLPLVTLRCQEQVLERLRQAPQFEAGKSLSMELPA